MDVRILRCASPDGTGPARLMPILITSLAIAAALNHSAFGQLLISGNETKIDLASGTARAISTTQGDSISIIDMSTWPPRVKHISDIPNTVIGPPSNIALFANGRRALVANSIKLDPQATPDPWEPAYELQLVQLDSSPPKVIQVARLGRQPSGLSFVPHSNLVLVANRAGGSVSVVRVTEDSLDALAEVQVAAPEASVSDVAVHPNGKSALVSLQKDGVLAELKIDGDKVTATGNHVSVAGQPYRVVITPDGDLGLTAGQGHAANGVDVDALTIVDMRTNPIRTLGYANIGSVVESIEISPNGRWLAAALMAGSNFSPDDPRHSPHGQMAIMQRNGDSFTLLQTLNVGRIPEGIAFTNDGRHLLIQCHPSQETWVFRVTPDGVEDTGHRIKTSGFPSSLRSE